jgi:hypothetical protein
MHQETQSCTERILYPMLVSIYGTKISPEEYYFFIMFQQWRTS